MLEYWSVIWSPSTDEKVQQSFSRSLFCKKNFPRIGYYTHLHSLNFRFYWYHLWIRLRKDVIMHWIPPPRRTRQHKIHHRHQLATHRLFTPHSGSYVIQLGNVTIVRTLQNLRNFHTLSDFQDETQVHEKILPDNSTVTFLTYRYQQVRTESHCFTTNLIGFIHKNESLSDICKYSMLFWTIYSFLLTKH